MKNTIKKLFALIIVFAMLLSAVACNDSGKDEDQEEKQAEPSVCATCYNGIFKGKYEEETGVLSFKGIPYAKAPVGELRWKAPVAPDASSEEYEAYEYGKSSIQYYWHSEDITTDVGEDCLTLNVWTDNLEDNGKAVMVFIHGGAYAWGGSSEPLYNGQYVVAEHSDVVFVTINYRLGIMGFASFDNVEGGEEFADSKNLGLLDCIQALEWVKQNIEAFGGDPNNVTVFGESAGGTITSALLLTDAAGTLFQRAIVESGPINLSMSYERSETETTNVDMLVEYTGAKNMDDLMALTEEELIEANEYEWDEDGTCINDCYRSLARSGYIVPADVDDLYRISEAKNVDLMIGSTLDELSYWINEMALVSLGELSEEERAESLYLYNTYFAGGFYEEIRETVSEEDLAYVDQYIALQEGMTEEEAISRLLGDLYFRADAIKTAEEHSQSDGTGRTYMYLFEKENDAYDGLLKACHASELAYVFHNLSSDEFSGTIDEGLADKVCAAWVNFAKTGDPSTDEVVWTEYDAENRATMVMGNDCSMKMVNDPESEERQLLKNLIKYNFVPTGA